MPFAAASPSADAVIVAAVLLLGFMLLVQRRVQQELAERLAAERSHHQVAERKYAELAALTDATNLLHLHIDRLRLLDAACARLSTVFDAPLVAVLVVGEDDVLTVAAQQCRSTAGLGDFRVPVGDGLIGRVARYGKGVSIPTVQLTSPGHRAEAALRAVQHVVAVPLRVRTEVVGVLVVGCDDDPQATDRVAALTIFGTSLAWILERNSELGELRAKARKLAFANRTLVESNRKSEVFLATATHELRTPLTGIVSYAEVLAEYYDTMQDEERRPLCQDLNAQCNTMMGLVDELFDFARLESGRLTLDLEDTRIDALVHSALDIVGPRAAERRITIHREVDAAVDLRVDPTKIRQCVLNLVSNAIKFTEPDGSVIVRVSQSNAGVEVEVEDTGRDIAADEINKVFELYRQTSGRKSGEKGLGLGLYLVKNFIELHGGEIRAKSELGVGSTFRFALPFRAAPEGEGQGDRTAAA